VLTNPGSISNRSGLIECEVEPAQHVSGIGKDFKSIDPNNIGNISDALEAMQAHRNRNSQSNVGGSQWQMGHFPATVPHSHEDRTGILTLLLPSGAAFNVLSELNFSASKRISTSDKPRIRTVTLTVVSGKPEHGKGFYHTKISLPGFTLLTFLLSRGSDPNKGIREMMTRAQVGGVRKLFGKLDAGVLPPLACAGILAEIADLQNDVGVLSQQLKHPMKDEPKPDATWQRSQADQ
jgi:hypothetical protein